MEFLGKTNKRPPEATESELGPDSGLNFNMNLPDSPACLALPKYTRHDEDLREPLVRRQGSQVSMRVHNTKGHCHPRASSACEPAARAPPASAGWAVLGAYCMQDTCHMGGGCARWPSSQPPARPSLHPCTFGSPVSPYITGVRLGWCRRMDVSGVTAHKGALWLSRHHFGQERSRG